MPDYTITPWEVKGNIDYDKIINDFGVSRIDTKILERLKKHTKEIHPFLRRNIFFAHRDLDFILNEYEKGNKFFLYTGRAPSGPVHMGHLLPWIFTQWLHEKFKVDLWFQIPDEEKFLMKEGLTLEDTHFYTKENVLDILALGFDTKKLHFLIDTRDAGIMYKEAIKVAKEIKFSQVKAAFGFTDQNNIGAIFYTAMQAVPTFLPSVLENRKIPCLIPHAIDQDPHFRLSRDVLPKLGFYKPASIQCRFLPDLRGIKTHGKMSASLGTEGTIFTTDTPESVATKIHKYAFSGGKDTIKEHREKGGNPDIDVSYQWLTFLEPSDKKLEKIYHDYKSGALLTKELKEILIKTLNQFLEQHQKAREKAKKDLKRFKIE